MYTVSVSMHDTLTKMCDLGKDKETGLNHLEQIAGTSAGFHPKF